MFYTKSGRPIHYYGEERSDQVTALKKNTSVKTIDDFFELLLECWCRETAYPSSQADYDHYNDPTYGQCAITATLVYDVFGGTIHKIRVDGGGTHYFNKINGAYYDLTRDQFDLYNIPVEYEPNQEISREYCGKNANTKARFDLLKERIVGYIRGNLKEK